MSEIKWIKITTDIFDDEKILLIESMPEADSIIVIWFKLLCLAGKQNNGGVFLMNNRIHYTEKMLSTIFRRKETTVRMALETFEQFGMIEVIDDVITIPNWEKHQNIEQMDKIREQTRQRVARFREKKLLECNVTSNVTSNATVTEGNATDKNRIDKKREDKVFIPPTLEEVEEYCRGRNSIVDPKAFYDYFTAGNWTDSQGKKVKNWKQKVITWETHNVSKMKVSSNFSTETGNDYDKLAEDSMEKIIKMYGD